MSTLPQAIVGAANRSPLGRAWARIREPKVIKVILTVGFLMTFMMGVSAVVSPPNSIEGEIGTLLTYMWGAFLMIGGSLGAASTLPGWWIIERIGILSCMVGLGIYAVVVLSMQLTSDGNRFPQWFLILFAAMMLAAEGARTWGHNFEPKG